MPYLPNQSPKSCEDAANRNLVREEIRSLRIPYIVCIPLQINSKEEGVAIGQDNQSQGGAERPESSLNEIGAVKRLVVP